MHATLQGAHEPAGHPRTIKQALRNQGRDFIAHCRSKVVSNQCQHFNLYESNPGIWSFDAGQGQRALQMKTHYGRVNIVNVEDANKRNDGHGDSNWHGRRWKQTNQTNLLTCFSRRKRKETLAKANRLSLKDRNLIVTQKSRRSGLACHYKFVPHQLLLQIGQGQRCQPSEITEAVSHRLKAMLSNLRITRPFVCKIKQRHPFRAIMSTWKLWSHYWIGQMAEHMLRAWLLNIVKGVEKASLSQKKERWGPAPQWAQYTTLHYNTLKYNTYYIP